MKKINKLKELLNLSKLLRKCRAILILCLVAISVSACTKNILGLGNPNLKYSDVLKCVIMTDEEIDFISDQTLDMILYNNELICEDE
jgi:hypothetical protein